MKEVEELIKKCTVRYTECTFSGVKMTLGVVQCLKDNEIMILTKDGWKTVQLFKTEKE